MRNLVVLGGTAALALALVACGDDTGGSGGSGAGGDDATSTTASGSTSSGGTTSASTTSASTTSGGSTGSGEGGSGAGGSGAGGSGAGGSGAGGSGDGGAGGGPSASVVEVPCDGAEIAREIGTQGLSFDPEEVTVAPGDVIRFTPTGAHDMDSDGDAFATPTGAVACLRFDVAGEYPYHCSVHGQSMSGVVIVE